jgi:hypothetical protein
MKHLRRYSKFKLSWKDMLYMRRLHKASSWLSYGSLKGQLGHQPFCRSTPDFLFRVVSRNTPISGASIKNELEFDPMIKPQAQPGVLFPF